MSNILKSWTFRAKAATKEDETLCVTGSCDALGHWSVNKLFKLAKENDLWSGTADIPDYDIYYRYCLCHFDKLNDKIMVLKWETFQNARIIKQQTKPTTYDTFGNRNIEPQRILNFCEEDEFQINHLGWLTSDQILQLNIHYDSIRFTQSDFSYDNLRLKVTASGVSKVKQPDRDLDVEILLHENESKFRLQDEHGYRYDGCHSAVFMTRTFLHEFTEFVVHMYKPGDKSFREIATSRLVLNDPYEKSVEYSTPKIRSSEGEVVGNMSIKCVRTRPTRGLNFDFKRSYSRYWKRNWIGLNIGHRGAGITRTMQDEVPEYVENTIGAVQLAHEKGVDMVEIDVQLTKDLVPVLCHNFELFLSSMNDQTQSLSVNQFTYEELLVSFDRNTAEIYHPFPSLESLLKNTDETLPIFLELKYPLELTTGGFECPNKVDMNLFVDTILKTVFANCGSRFFIFACFNRDVSFMIRMKQNKYPVIILAKFDQTHTRYKDKIAYWVPSAINYLTSINLLGLGVHVDSFQKYPDAIRDMMRKRVITFSWGIENDTNHKSLLKKHRIHGIILDGISKERINCGCKLSKERFP